MRTCICPKSILTILLSIGLIFSCKRPDPPATVIENDFYEHLKTDPEFAGRFKIWDKNIQDYLDHQNQGIQVFALRSTTITIPVVVHVIHSGEAVGTGKNIAQTVIDDQIRILNEDFGRLNPRYLTPSGAVASALGAFGTLATDTRIRFELAKRSPSCTATTGVSRKLGGAATYAYNAGGATAAARNPVKFNASGEDGWDSQKYLNIWVCDLTGAQKGYPSEAADLAARPTEDGVVIDYQWFGTAGTSLGQSATFHVARWLGLRPLFPCAGDDGIADTPQQSVSTGCPAAFPDPSACVASPSGAMFVNFLSSQDDNCRVMFTAGQADVMNATLFTTRSGLLGSEALTPPPAVTTDLYAKDTDDDLGNEPNTESTVMYRSDDIWVRNSNDGIANQEHQNPVGGATNYVYVRVRNRGCASSPGGNVRLYWAKAGSGLDFPNPWTGGVTSAGGAPMGGQIGSPTSSGTVNASGSTIVTFTWATPDPAVYAADFPGDAGHFCLLADVNNEIPASPPNIWDMVKNKNGIVWKNIEVGGAMAGMMAQGIRAGGLAGNFSEKPKDIKLEFVVPAGEASPFLWGDIALELNDKMFESWKQGGQISKNITFDGTKGQIQTDAASLEHIILPPHTYLPVSLVFKQKTTAPPQRNIYKILMNQYELVDGQYKITGGQQFVLKTEHQPVPETKDPGKPGINNWWWGALAVLVALLLWWFRRKKQD